MQQASLSEATQKAHTMTMKTVGRSIRGLGLWMATVLLGTAMASAQPTFTNAGASLTGVHHGSALWGDYDRDGKLDVLLTGMQNGGAAFADIYRNDSSSFLALAAGLAPIYGSTGNSRSAWGDFDNDGDLDVIITGLSGVVPSGPITKLFQNNGGTFTPVTISANPFADVALGSVKWADFDNDGDLDLFVTGTRNGSTRFATIYRNDGANGSGGWNFTDIDPTLSNIRFMKVMWSDGDFGDYDNDGDLDLIVMGYSNIGSVPQTIIYRNDGGYFVKTSIRNIEHLGNGSVAWGDCNNDGYLDILISGSKNSFQKYLLVYRNNQNGTFTQTASLIGISDGSAAWGDYNNDGKLDIVATGDVSTGTPLTTVYIGAGNGTFTADPNAALTDLYESQASWGDYDNDGRLDILIAGHNGSTSSSTIYRNVASVSANTAPTAPSSLSLSASSAHSLSVSWNAGTDNETPTNALTYNLSIFDVTANKFVMSPMADLATGTRWLAQMGNTNHNRAWTIGRLTPGHTYSICVQTIDGAFAPSPFTCGLSVTLPSTTTDAMIGDCPADLGAEPNMICSALWNSSNIYVRNLPDGLTNTSPQNPIWGQTNYVYVKVKNISTATLPNGTVHVYFAKASTGLDWPRDWNGNYVGGVRYGDFIGQATITALLPGATATVQIPWNTVPNPADYGDPDARHFCLLARLTSAADPITFAEVQSNFTNVQNNNNIAWKNVTIVNKNDPGAPIEIYNPREGQVFMTLRGTAAPEDTQPVTTICQFRVDLGHDLFTRWTEGGAQGIGIVIATETPSPYDVWFVGPLAQLQNIRMEEEERFTARVHVVYPEIIPPHLAGQVFTWHLTQIANTEINPIGGEAYAIHLPAHQATKSRIGGASDLSNMLQLGAYPNPASTGSTISYTLTGDSRITLALYDAAGRLVRTLLSDSEQKAGTHAIEWDGNSNIGAPAPSGTYFYRIGTDEGSAQGQIIIAR